MACENERLESLNWDYDTLERDSHVCEWFSNSVASSQSGGGNGRAGSCSDILMKIGSFCLVP